MSNLFYNNKKIGGGVIYTSPQVSVLPTPSEDYEGTILQYIGTDGTYSNGFFYKCELDGLQYKWKKIALDIPPVDSGNVYTDLELSGQDMSVSKGTDYTFWVENETICHLILHLKNKRTNLYANRWYGTVLFSIKNKSYNPPARYLIAPATINTSTKAAVRIYGSSTSSSYGGIDLYLVAGICIQKSLGER